LAPEVVEACRDAGLYLLAAPTEAGGVEASLRDVFDATEMIAQADPSASWYVTNSMAACHAAAWIDPEFYEPLYASNGGNFGFSAAPGGRLTPTEGGYRLSGEWPLVTGVSDATYAALNTLLPRPEAKGMLLRLCLVPTAEMTIDEVWNEAAAMRGTGSHRVEIDDTFVPETLAVDLAAPPLLNRPRFAGIGVPHVGGVANTAVSVGVFQAALDALGDELRGKVSTISGAKATDMASVMELVAHARAALVTLRYGTYGVIDELWASAQTGDGPTLTQRADAVGMQFHASKVAREFISELYSRSSRAAFFNDHPLERALRNIHAIAYAFEPLRTIQHDIGRLAIGIEPKIPRF